MTITKQLTLVITITAAIIALANTWLVAYNYDHTAKQQRQNWVNTLTIGLDAVLSTPHATENFPAVSEILHKLSMSETSLFYIFITDSSGNIVADSFNGQAPGFAHAMIKPGSTPEDSVQHAPDGSKIYQYTSQSVTSAGNFTLHIGTSQAPGANTLIVVSQHFLIYSVVIGIFAVVGTLLIGRNISKPLRHLGIQIQDYLQNQKPGRKPLPTHDPDIRRLTEDFSSVIQNRATAEAKTREHLLTTTLQSINDALITADNHGKISMMNPVAEQLTGWCESSAMGRPLAEVFSIINASTRDSIPGLVDKVISTNDTVILSNDTTLISRTGDEHQITNKATPIRNEAGEIVSVILVFHDISEAYRLKRLNALQQKRTRAHWNHIPLALVEWNDQNIVTNWNPAAEQFFGYSRSEAIGSAVADLLLPDTLSTNERKIQLSLLSNTDDGGKIIRHSTKTGKTLLCEWHTSTATGDDDRTYWLSAADDITERDRLQRIAEQSHHQLERVIADISAVVGTMRPDGIITFVNKATLSPTNLTADEVVGLHLWETPWIQDSDQGEVVRQLVTRAASGETVRMDAQITVPGIGLRWIEFDIHPVKDDRGNIIELVPEARDVTARKRSEEQLAKQREELSQLLDGMAEAVLTAD